MPLKEFLKQNKNWIIIALIIFLAGMAFSGLPTYAGTGRQINLEQLLGPQSGDLADIVKTLQDLPPLAMVFMILINNLISVAQMLLLNFLTNLSPLFTLFVNGALMGAIAGTIAREGQPLLLFFFLGILPHGIFELPAFFICGALGLKFGYHCIASPLPGMSRKQSFFHIWKESASLFRLIISLLALGALVEVYISKALVFNFLVP